jgi:transposase-like protein
MSEKRRRITAKMKLEIVVRMFRGESLDILSREIDIPAERLTKWKEAFIKGGIENVKIKPNSPEIIENKMLKEMIGEKSMEIELLYQKIDKLEAGLLPKSRKSKKPRK